MNHDNKIGTCDDGKSNSDLFEFVQIVVQQINIDNIQSFQ